MGLHLFPHIAGHPSTTGGGHCGNLYIYKIPYLYLHGILSTTSNPFTHKLALEFFFSHRKKAKDCRLHLSG